MSFPVKIKGPLLLYRGGYQQASASVGRQQEDHRVMAWRQSPDSRVQQALSISLSLQLHIRLAGEYIYMSWPHPNSGWNWKRKATSTPWKWMQSRRLSSYFRTGWWVRIFLMPYSLCVVAYVNSQGGTESKSLSVDSSDICVGRDKCSKPLSEVHSRQTEHGGRAFKPPWSDNSNQEVTTSS